MCLVNIIVFIIYFIVWFFDMVVMTFGLSNFMMLLINLNFSLQSEPCLYVNDYCWRRFFNIHYWGLICFFRLENAMEMFSGVHELLIPLMCTLISSTGDSSWVAQHRIWATDSALLPLRETARLDVIFVCDADTVQCIQDWEVSPKSFNFIL